MSRSRKRESKVSLEHAQRQSQQRLRLFGQAVVHELDAETFLAIEVNGVPVTRVACMDSALAELAAGWTFMHRFCESPAEFDRATAQEFRASVMVQGGIDILHRRGILLGEFSEPATVPEPWPQEDNWSVPEDVLLDILREAWVLFGKDRMSEGSIHAALASEVGVEVVAFDIIAENAVAKVLGWCLQANRLPAYPILIVNGLISRTMVDAAVRLGVRIIASPHVPTADAFKTARVSGMSLVGYMRHETVGLFGNPGLVTFDDDTPNST